MYYVPCSRITIAGMRFAGIHEVNVKRSVFEIAATASVKVPVSAVLRQYGVPPTQIEVARAIKVGDPVEIQLGYNGVYTREFRGYVKILNLQTPLEIVCEDEFYKTRERSVTLQGRTTLAAILAKCGLKAAYAASLTIDNFVVDNKPVSWVLGKLKTDYGLSIFFDPDGSLYASEPYKIISDEVRYRLRWNVIKDDDLLFHRADDVRIKIKAVCIYKNGTKVEAKIGPEDGTEKKLYFYDVGDVKELAALADAELKRYSYDGYSGKIETFLWPFACPTMTAVLEDPAYHERDGRYYVETVETQYGRSGARRIVGIGLKV